MTKYRYFTNKRNCPYINCKLKCWSKKNHHQKYSSMNKKKIKKDTRLYLKKDTRLYLNNKNID